MKRALLMIMSLGLPAQPVAATPHPQDSGKSSAQKAPARGPRLGVEPASFDFGRVLQRKTLSKEFSLHNYGTEDLLIESVSTTCGCTVAEGYAKVIKPGDSTPLRVALETRSFTGRVERKVLIRTNDPTTKLFEVRVEATVAGPETKK